MLDFVFIFILAMGMMRIVPRGDDMGPVGDFVGSAMLCTFVYVLLKAVPHSLIGGWTFPVNPDPMVHAASGAISFALCCGLLGIIVLRRKAAE